MWRWITGFLASIGFLVFLLLLLGVILATSVKPVIHPVPDTAILSLDLSKEITASPPRDPLARLFSGGAKSLRDILDALDRAAADPRVKGVFARLGSDKLGTASLQELRDAIAAFRAKGKFAVAFADTFGEFSPGTRPYYLATAFDEIWLQPLGEIGLTGLRLESPYLRGALDKLGIIPRLDHRSEYKSAMNTFTEKTMTPPEREEDEALLKSIHAQIVHGIAASRRLDESHVQDLINDGPYLAADAAKLRLVDHLGFRDEAVSAAKTRAGADAKLIRVNDYLDGAGRPNEEGPTIALIYATGIIQRSGGENDMGVLGAEAVSRAFREARADPSVKSVLFRIDSPGGSAVASETIWREVVKTREAKIPVIASMGDVAGSGGYFIAAGADKIVAEPATLTGSIGVVAGKLLTGGLWEKLGINWASLQTGSNGGMFSTIEDFSPTEEKNFQSFLDAVYAGFKERVASGRHLDPDTVERLAKGRVWSGEDGKRNGLVDELGGFDTALRLAKLAANIAAEAPVRLKRFPPEENAVQFLRAHLFGRKDEEDDTPLPQMETLRQKLQGVVTALRDFALLLDPPGAFTMRRTDPVE